VSESNRGKAMRKTKKKSESERSTLNKRRREIH